MRRLITAAVLAGTVLLLAFCKEEAPFSMQVVRSEMTRCPDADRLDGLEGRLKWNYTTGLELLSFLEAAQRYGGEDIFEYVESWYDRMVGEDGSILTYKTGNFSTDHVCPGRTLFKLYDRTGKEKYRMAMDTLRRQLSLHPRTSEGGFWHKKVYPHQMWLDGLYMAQPFYAEYASRYEEGSVREESFRDIVNNFLVVARHTYDPATGLYRHAWDESRSMFWCDKATGQSAHAWGRALGWYCMAIVDAMPLVPDGTPGKDEVLGIFRNIYETLPRYSDPATGLWYQVLDRPGAEGNYLESTCCAMFIYAMLKGIRMGYLDASLYKDARKAYSAMLDTFVTTDGDGLVNLGSCCAVAGLGGKDNRSGDYDYYINERICSNDPKGIGPLVMASLEIERK